MAYANLDAIQRAANGQVASPLWADQVNDNSAAHQEQLAQLPTIQQWGSNVVDTNSSGGASIFFPTAFPNAIGTVVICFGDDDANAYVVQLISAQVSATGFGLVIYTASTGLPVGAGIGFRINWIAIGS